MDGLLYVWVCVSCFSGSNQHLHSPYNQVSHSPGLPQFGLHSTSHGSSFSSLPPSPLHNLIPTAGGPQSMFAAPLPPGAANGSLTSPHSLGGANLSTHASPESMSLASKCFHYNLHQAAVISQSHVTDSCTKKAINYCW